MPGWANAIQMNKGKTFKIDKIADGEFIINLKERDEICLSSTTNKTKMIMKPIFHKADETNLYAVNKGMSYKKLWNILYRNIIINRNKNEN